MKLSDQNWERMQWLLSLLLHSFVAMAVSAFVGGLPEVALSRYLDPRIKPYAPIIAMTALVLGYFVSRQIASRAATFVWIVGVLWISCGFYSVASSWSREWSTHSTRWSYATANLFTTSCSETECLNQLIFTIPFVATFAYTLGAWLRKLDLR
jgi:hypothetical protein